MSDAAQPDSAHLLEEHLTDIIRHWDSTAEPMNPGVGGSLSSGIALPSSTIVLRADITRTLAFWVHALLDDHPVVLQRLENGAIPPSAPRAHPPHRLIVVTDTLDCTDVPAMAGLLRREIPRLLEWADGKWVETIIDDLQPLATAARLVSRPPKRDRITLGYCTCGGQISARAVRWARDPHPTTNPAVYPLWSEYRPVHAQPIQCPSCRVTRTVPEWLTEIVGTERALPADELVDRIHADLGMRYSPKTVRVWANRGYIKARGYARDGRAVYDRVQVYAALIERTREDTPRVVC